MTKRVQTPIIIPLDVQTLKLFEDLKMVNKKNQKNLKKNKQKTNKKRALPYFSDSWTT